MRPRVLTLIFAVTMLSGFTDSGSPRFDTITVQRINVVEPDGTLRMVLTNNQRLPGVIQHGKEYPNLRIAKAERLPAFFSTMRRARRVAD